FWDDYCSWYLEAVKPAYGQPLDKATMDATNVFLEKLLKMIHPVMPFISEELWQSLAGRGEGETIMYQPSPVAGSVDERVIADFETAKEVAGGVRSIRQQKNISPKEALEIKVKGAFPMDMVPVISKLANVSSAEQVGEFSGNGISFLVGTVEIFVPLGGLVDAGEEIAKIESELTRLRGFLEGVRKKLANESFTAHAPEKVVALERKKESDALLKIENLENSLKALKLS
ncbi:MAG: class I tRNA ligase family protein, partial [Bacteroidales bacterium]|nr:class I tRNA ligase family protein [Bacteroidales bacterium]